MRNLFIASFIFTFYTLSANAQLNITPFTTGQALAQYLVGDGVQISNIQFTGDPQMAGFFKNISGTNIDIDSGIVLTTGRALTSAGGTGVSGSASSLANTSYNLPNDGDIDLANATGLPLNMLHDNCILEFDFVPLGDSIRFKYVMSSEEYTSAYVCRYNDAFGFFISGPGFPGTTNIALIPNTTTPVTIKNVNNIPTAPPPFGPCISFPQYYVDNTGNTRFTHDGHTVIFTAETRVQPCQTYHLKLVICDYDDHQWDSGVFLEAKSLTSNAFQLTNLTKLDPVSNQSFLVEGCEAGRLKIKRQNATLFSQNVNFTYGGSAINGVDVQLLPSFITIPAGDTVAFLDINPIMDFTPEGIEDLKIYIMAPCATGQLITDSATIQIRDYDILQLTPDSVNACRNEPIQLQASGGYTTYSWNNDPTLSSTTIPNPIAIPIQQSTTYIATATLGTCNAMDSVYIRMKDIELISKTDLICFGNNSGQIKVGAGAEWFAPLQFNVNNQPFQADSTFNGLAAGSYWVKVNDGAGCLDSISVTLTEPSMMVPNISTAQSTCTGLPDGSITINPTGGTNPFLYSIDNGTTFQPGNIFNVVQGAYNIIVKDSNSCISNAGPIVVTLNDDLTINVPTPTPICEGTSTVLQAIAPQAETFNWQPATALSSTNTASTTANPIVTTQYIATVTKGICTHSDTVILVVYPAPIPDAGPDVIVCFGANGKLSAAQTSEYFWAPPTYLSSTSTQSPDVIKPQSSIKYVLRVKDNNGCNSLTTDTMQLTVTPPVKMRIAQDTMVAIGQPFKLWAYPTTNANVMQYSWSPTFGLDNPYISKPTATLDRDMVYTVTGRTPGDCEGSAQVKVKVYQGPEIYVPTAFTPNGDGLNEVLKPYCIGIKSMNYFRIYNRWGQEVFSTTQMNTGWDGRFKGQQLPGAQSYVWIAEGIDYTGKVIKRKGMFTLVR